MADSEKKNVINDDEIDLSVYWQAIVRRWKLISVLVLASIVVASIAVQYLPKIYRINAIISLGRVDGKPLANLDDISQMMSSGNLVKKVTTTLHLDERVVGTALESGISAQSKKDSEYVFLEYDTADPNMGIQILDQLISEIQKAYHSRTENYRKSKEAAIDRLKEEITAFEYQKGKAEIKINQLKTQVSQRKQLALINDQTLKKQKVGIADQIKNYQQRIAAITDAKNQLNSLSSTLEQNTQDLLKGKTVFAQTTTGEGVLASLLFSNNLQQNITAMNQNKGQLADYDMAINDARKAMDNLTVEQAIVDGAIKKIQLQAEMEIDKLKSSITETELEIKKSLPSEIGKIKNDIQGLEAAKAMIEDITVIAQPDYLNKPVKPKKRMIVTGSAGLALFFGLILAIAMNRPCGKENCSTE
jgi:hypothetical protein